MSKTLKEAINEINVENPNLIDLRNVEVDPKEIEIGMLFKTHKNNQIWKVKEVQSDGKEITLETIARYGKKRINYMRNITIRSLSKFYDLVPVIIER